MLWAHGVPVWFDQDDLGVGDWRVRIREALRGGISGGVIVVTPEAEKSRALARIEVPNLQDLGQEAPDFCLAILSSIEREDAPGEVDWIASESILDTERGALSGIRHFNLNKQADLENLVFQLARHRVAACARSGDGPLELDIDTYSRSAPAQLQRPLVVRAPKREGEQRRPPAELWPPYAAFLARLPELLDAAGRGALRVCGGGHLSVACAMGAAVPTTSRYLLEVIDSAGGVWSSRCDDEAIQLVPTRQQVGAGGLPVAVFVDLGANPATSNAFDRFLDGSGRSYSATLRIVQASRGYIPSQAGAATASAIADMIRDLCSTVQLQQVDLFFKGPFAIALLLGQRLNTIRVRVHELEEPVDGVPYYVPVVELQPGASRGPVVEILS